MNTTPARQPLSRFTAWLVALLFTLMLLPIGSLTANAEQARPVSNLFGSNIKGESDPINSLAQVGDTLYIRTMYGLYVFGPGDSKARLVTSMMFNNGVTGKEKEPGYEPRIVTILPDGQRLLGLDPYEGALYQLQVTGDQVALSKLVNLDFSGMHQGEGVYRFAKSFDWMLMHQGRLFLKLSNYGEEMADLYSFDMTTGERKLHQVRFLMNACSYKDGSLIGLLIDPEGGYDPETGEQKKPEFAIFNPQDDSLTPTGSTLPFVSDMGEYAGLYYDAQEDSLYTYSDSDLFRYTGDLKTHTVVGHLPMYGALYVPRFGNLQPLPDGRLAVAFGYNVFLRARTEEGRQGITQLTLGGYLDDPGMLGDALMEADDLVLHQAPTEYRLYDQQSLAALFLTGATDVDLMVLNAGTFDLDRLMEKGYLADLSGEPAIKAYLAGMAPNLSRSFMKDGKIYALPLSLLSFSGVAYVQAFKELGLKVPTSLTGLIDLFENWLTGLAEKYPDYKLLGNENNALKTVLRRAVMDKYIYNKLSQGELSFDTPEFRSLMDRVENLPYGDSQSERSNHEEMQHKKPLLEFSMGFEPRYAMGINNRGERQHVPLYLSIGEGEHPQDTADFTMLVVLSSSQKQQQAIRLLSHLVDKLDVADKAAITPGQTQAIPNPYYEKGLAFNKRYLEQLKEQLTRAEGAQKSDLEQHIKEREREWDAMVENLRYLATEEDLAMIHQMVSALYVPSGLANAQRQAMQESYETREQYYAGAITLDQFIKQMDDKLRMVRNEYN